MTAFNKGARDDASAKEGISKLDLVRIVERALKFPPFPPGEITAEQFIANRKAFYDVFGAPGDWGYGTMLGDALQALYAKRVDVE